MRRELVTLLRLAGPVILADIGWMSMGLVDTMMVGPLGPAAIAATGLGSGVFTAVAVLGMGLMLGLDTFVSNAHGAGDDGEAVRWLHHGVWLAILVAPAAMAATWLLQLTLDTWGLHPEVEILAGPFLRVVAAGSLPLMVYAALRRYLQGMHVVRPIMYALITANVLNVAGNWVLIYGNLGMPALGVEGAAWATTISRAGMALFLYGAIRRFHRRRAAAQPHVPLVFDVTRIRRLVTFSFPAASQVTLEVGVFAVATALAGKLDPVASGAHQIALNIAGFAFMVPLGLSSAAAVRVGHACGAGDSHRAEQSGWLALGVGALIMLAIGVVFLLWPAPLMRIFTDDVRIIDIGAGLLGVAAAFQLFDGTQAVATGVLRGAGETRTPMIVNLIGHWFLGLPAGYVLCFWLAWGVIGLWVGLSIGLIVVALVLTGTWRVRAKALHEPVVAVKSEAGAAPPPTDT